MRAATGTWAAIVVLLEEFARKWVNLVVLIIARTALVRALVLGMCILVSVVILNHKHTHTHTHTPLEGAGF